MRLGFFGFFIVSTVVAYLLRRKDWTSFQRISYAMAFLTMVAAYELYPTLSEMPPSYYHILNVPTDAGPSAIRKAFKAMSLRFHPDKWTTASAETQADITEKFAAIREAYEVLNNRDSRRVYASYGMKGLAHLADAGTSSSDLLLFSIVQTVLFYAASAVHLVIISLFSRSGSYARQWAFVVLFVFLVFEASMTLGDYNAFSDTMPYTPVFQQVEIMHALLPIAVQYCIILVTHLHVDPMDLLHAKIDVVQRTLISLQHQVRDLELELDADKNTTGGKPTGAGLSAGAKAVETARRKKRDIANPPMPQKGKSYWGLAVPIGLYILFNYVLK